MHFARRKSVAVALALLSILVGAAWAFAPTAHAIEPQAAMESQPQQLQPSAPLPPPTPEYLRLEHRSGSQMDAADLSLIHAKQQEIVSEAAFFAYDLTSDGWTYDQAVCPALPDELLLHYRRQSRDGAESLFTALVPRGSGRVFVVPVLYRNATPFRPATTNGRSIAVFNRVIPDDIAQKAVQPDGNWLVLALCYADMVGADAHAMKRPGPEVALAPAPTPILRYNEARHVREIIFTDRDAPGQYLVWDLNLNDKGRVTAATALRLADYVAQMPNPAEPHEKPLPDFKEPPVRTLPPQQEPPTKPAPQ